VTESRSHICAMRSLFIRSVLISSTPSSKRRRCRPWLAIGALAGLTLFACLPGCTASATLPSLASGERPVTGDARYDTFFADINDLYAAVKEAQREEAEVRGALARRIGLSEHVATDVLGSRLRERTAKLAAEGLTLELEFTGIDDTDDEDEAADPELASGNLPGNAPREATSAEPEADSPDVNAVPPTATLRTPGREPERGELRLLKVLAQAALSGVTIYSDMGLVHRRTEHLLTEAGKLRDNVDATFTEPEQRERVRVKLDEAEELLPRLSEQARSVTNSADLLIALLDEAANTAPVGPPRRRPASTTRESAVRGTRDSAAPDTTARDPGPTPERAPRRSTLKPAESLSGVAPKPPAPASPP
jgi:hypothetical protein